VNLFKRIGRGATKIYKKNRKGAGKLLKKVGPAILLSSVPGGAVATVAAKAVSKAKSLGKKVGGIETPKSLAPVLKLAKVGAKKRTRTKMPGGASMPSIPRPGVGMMSSSPQPKRSLYRSAKRSVRRTKQPTQIYKNGKPASKVYPTGTKKSTIAKAKRRITKPPSAAQLAARERFKKMVAAKRKGA